MYVANITLTGSAMVTEQDFLSRDDSSFMVFVCALALFVVSRQELGELSVPATMLEKTICNIPVLDHLP